MNNRKSALDRKRSGKWTLEEEHFAQRLMIEFEAGTLPFVKSGCTLREFLSDKLRCSPMRISKKFTGRSIGKKLYTRDSNKRIANMDDLSKLESQFLQSITTAERIGDEVSEIINEINNCISPSPKSSSNYTETFKDDSHVINCYKTGEFKISTLDSDLKTLLEDDVISI
mmetsp:Transcript_31935/g.43610  ORF Transcript_31935/g.43610 Transcript_31935/m.43610 type:complete len:170 (+) Transcript_31935:50-559(+)